jgi:hypothetical protein
MSVEIRKLKAEDLSSLSKKNLTNYIGFVSPEQAKVLENGTHNYTVLVDGSPLLCIGVAEYWNGRGEAWAVFDPECKAHFFKLHNAAKKLLAECPVKRIEASVAVEFTPGHRWVRALGFTLENFCARSFLPDGKDASLYSRILVGVGNG